MPTAYNSFFCGYSSDASHLDLIVFNLVLRCFVKISWIFDMAIRHSEQSIRTL